MRAIALIGVLAFLIVAKLAIAIPLPVGIQELSFSFTFVEGGWGEVRGTMTAIVDDNPSFGSQRITPIDTGWRFFDPDRQVRVVTHSDSYPEFSFLALEDGVVTGGYLELIVYDPNIRYRQALPEGWDFADFHHRLGWNYANMQFAAGGWMIHGGEPQIDVPVYSHFEFTVSPLTIGLKVPEAGYSGVLVALSMVAILGAKGARRSRAASGS